ncbi:MAG: symmetrical bis(5'-nucleosyl)-tetraphosphatase [Lysobacterales bacterium]
MSIYAIGDVQGCYDTLLRLLERVRFDPGADRLWFTGDLVNRGGQSLETLRFIRSLGDSAVVVLGNHDLHLIAESVKAVERRQKNTDLRRVLEAEDGAELIEWLRFRSLLHWDEDQRFVMVHAGLSPHWTLERARIEAERVERELRSKDFKNILLRMYGDRPRGWSRRLKGLDRTRATINVLTRMRYCDPRGQICFESKGAPGTQSAGNYPWFEVPGHKPRDFRVVAGHWSALGKFQGMGVFGVDTGCVWGGKLTALRIDADPEFLAVDSAQQRSNDADLHSQDDMGDRD